MLIAPIKCVDLYCLITKINTHFHADAPRWVYSKPKEAEGVDFPQQPLCGTAASSHTTNCKARRTAHSYLLSAVAGDPFCTPDRALASRIRLALAALRVRLPSRRRVYGFPHRWTGDRQPAACGLFPSWTRARAGLAGWLDLAIVLHPRCWGELCGV